MQRVLVREPLQASLLAAFGGTDLDARAAPLAQELRERRQVAGIASSTVPQTTAHGVKIEPMNMIVVATAVTNGQIDGLGCAAR